MKFFDKVMRFGMGALQLSSRRFENKNVQYDRQTVEVMRQALQQNSNCIDVGCHRGTIMREILRFAPNGYHLGFEPLPLMYAELLEDFRKFTQVQIFDYALSDSSGTASFQNVVSNPGYSGLLRRNYDRPNEQIEQISVRTQLLDNVVPKDCSIRFIKVDVEGAELGVFRGGIQTIKTNRPVIVFEHGLGAADHYGTKPEQIYKLLVDECELAMFVMEDWLESAGKKSLSANEFSKQFYDGQNFYFMAAPHQ